MRIFTTFKHSGLSELNTYLATRSYIEGYAPSQQDVIFKQIDVRMLEGSKYSHVARWYRHISSFPPSVMKDWSGTVKSTDPKEEKTKTSDKKKVEEKPEEEEESSGGFDPFADDAPKEEVDSDDERQKKFDAIAAKKKEEDKKNNKKVVIAKSSIVFEVKPYDSDTNMKSLKEEVLGIKMDGVTWGDGQFKPIAYGLQKLVIMATLIDELVDVDALKESLEAISLVQSADIFAWNKI